MKDRFEMICRNQPIPLFLTFDWMNAVSDEWDVLIYEENNIPLSIFVYSLKHKWFNSHLGSPSLTQFNGLYFLSEFNNRKDKLHIQNKIIEYFLMSIPSSYNIKLSLHSSILNLQAFYWNGFDLRVRYTYRLLNIKNYDLSQVSSRTRYEINKCKSKYSLNFTTDANFIYDLREKYVKKRNQRMSYDKNVLNRIVTYCIKNNNGMGFYLTSKLDGSIPAVCFVVRDLTSAYLIIHGSDTNIKDSSTSLLLFNVVKWASNYVDIFDFEGSMVKSIESTYRGLGGTQVPYYNISKNSSRIKRFLKSMLE